MIQLSKRLEAIVAMAASGANQESQGRGGLCVADIGTDHGFVPICLVERGIVAKAVAMDIGKGPLQKAREHVRASGLEGKIQLRLCDGLAALSPGEADIAVITGMGGMLMLRILREGGHVRESVGHWVFSPQSELGLFRHGLEGLGLAIRDEAMVEEDGKYYTVLAAGPGAMHYDEEFRYQYGDLLIRKKMPVLWEYLKKEERQLQNIQKQLQMQAGQASLKRLEEIEERLGYVKGAFNAMQGID